MDNLDALIRKFIPRQGAWLPLEQYFEEAFANQDPKQHYSAMFDLFERYPEDDGNGVFWSAVHGMEALGGYEELLLEHFSRNPSLMTTIMLRRLLNAGQAHIGGIAIADLLKEKGK